MVNFKFFTLYAVMAIAFVVSLAAMTVQATATGLSERQHGGGIPPVCHDCSCEQRICKVCPKCGPPKVLEVVEERQPVDPRPVRGGGGGGHQSICDNCSCNEYVCKKSCPQCQHHEVEAMPALVERAYRIPPHQGNEGHDHQSICDNCECWEHVCGKSCPKCHHPVGLLQE